jgi:hypothetical protein
MSIDKSKRRAGDRVPINVHESYELQCRTKHLAACAQRRKHSVKRGRSMAVDVRSNLGK